MAGSSLVRVSAEPLDEPVWLPTKPRYRGMPRSRPVSEHVEWETLPGQSRPPRNCRSIGLFQARKRASGLADQLNRDVTSIRLRYELLNQFPACLAELLVTPLGEIGKLGIVQS